MYCDFGYRKRTRIWTNVVGFEELQCDGTGSCGNMDGRHHVVRAMTGKTYDNKAPRDPRLARYRVPRRLVASLLSATAPNPSPLFLGRGSKRRRARQAKRADKAEKQAKSAAA